MFTFAYCFCSFDTDRLTLYGENSIIGHALFVYGNITGPPSAPAALLSCVNIVAPAHHPLAVAVATFPVATSSVVGTVTFQHSTHHVENDPQAQYPTTIIWNLDYRTPGSPAGEHDWYVKITQSRNLRGWGESASTYIYIYIFTIHF